MNKRAFLCLDDENVILQTLKYTLKNAFGDKYIYETANTADQAIEIIEDLEQADVGVILIISDWIMPNMSGEEFLKLVYSRWPSIKCIVVSGQISSAEIEEIKQETNVIEHFLKPWSGMELISTIRSKILNESS